MDIATFTPVKVLSLSPEQKKLIADKFPELSVADVPAGAADGVPAYSTWSFGLAVHARPDLSDEIAYQIAKAGRSEEHTSELQSLMRSSYDVFSLKLHI